MSLQYSVNGASPSGGVARQAPNLRKPDQVASGDNVVFDPAFGFSKRPGTVFDRAFTESPCADVRLAMLSYAANERYWIVYGRGASSPIVRGFRVGGNEATPTLDATAIAYLGINSPGGSSMRARPFKDEMLIVNQTAATEMVNTEGFAVDRTRKDYDSVVAFTTGIGTYVRAENDAGSASAGYYQYQPGSYTYAHINFNTLNSPWKWHYGYWDDATYFPCGFDIAFRRVALTGFTGATYTASSGTIAKVGAFASYTFKAGDCIYITAGTGFTANSWYKIASKTNNDSIVIVGGPGADNVNTAANVTDATYAETNICRIGRTVSVLVDFTKVVPIDMDDLASKFTNAMRLGGATNACCAWVPQSGDSGNFQITGPFRGTGAMVYKPTAPTNAPAGTRDLTLGAGDPLNAPASGQIFGGTGTLAGTDDDTATPESRWVRVQIPYQSKGQPNTAKMPVRLHRTAANALSLDLGSWAGRGSGDEVSNPGALLVLAGTPITDVALYKDRLWIVGGPFACSSQIKEHWQFFNDNYKLAKDLDPVNRTISGNGNANILSATGFRQSLVLFAGTGGQFEISATDALTPSTASVTQTNPIMSSDTAPAPFGTSLLFASKTSNYSRIFEYQYDDIRASFDAPESTNHVPDFIPANPRSISPSSASQWAVVTPYVSNGGNELYVLFAARDGGRRIQTAWARWVFDSGYRICDAQIMDDQIWILSEEVLTVTTAGGGTPTVAYPNHGLSTGNSVVFDRSTTSTSIVGTFTVTVIDANTFTIAVATSGAGTARACTGRYILEYLTIGTPPVDSGWLHAPFMDRRVRLTGTFAAGKTTWALTATPTVASGSSQFNGFGSTLNTVFLGPAFGASNGNTVLLDEYTTTSVKTTGNYSAGEVWIGRFFGVSVEKNRQFVRGQDGQVDIGSPTHVVAIDVSHANTSGYTVRTSYSPYPDRSIVFASSDGKTPQDFGKLVTTLAGESGAKAGALRVFIEDSSIRPLSITQTRWTLSYQPAFNTGGQ